MKKLKFQHIYTTNLYNTIGWLARIYPSPSRLQQLFIPLYLKLDMVIMTRGVEGLIDFVKSIRSSLLSYLSKTSTVSNLNIKVTKDGIPAALGDLIPIIRMSLKPTFERMLPFVNTVLWSTRSLKTKASPSLGSIVAPVLNDSTIFTTEDVQAFWKALGIRPSREGRVPSSLSWSKFHFSAKSGPNGHALHTSLTDLFSLPSEMKEKIKLFGGEKLSRKMQTLEENFVLLSLDFPIKSGEVRRLAYFPDKEMKTRVIGILDYFSQSALKPFHHFLYSILKKIRQDCTFDQASFKEKLCNAKEFYSIDLTAATDRFPIKVICSVLEGILPTEYISLWRDIMVELPFKVKLPSGETKFVRYEVGNPMGAYSSWASFAIANHFLVFYCCMKLNIEWKTLPYALLGDDIVIGNASVGEMYIETLNSLGVEVSLPKTHKSKVFYEFAKRLILNGNEISPFPISALRESQKRYYLLVNLFLETVNKGWELSVSMPESIDLFYSLVKPIRRKRRTVLKQKSEICELMTKVMRGILTANDAVNNIIRSKGYPIRELCNEEGKSLIQNIAVELFAESSPTGKETNGKPLGLLAEYLVTKYTGIDSFVESEFWKFLELSFQVQPENYIELFLAKDSWLDQIKRFDCSSLIEAIPILNVYGQVEITYMRTLRNIREIDAIKGGDWPIVLMNFRLLSSDKVFSMRAPKQRLIVYSILGEKVLERLNTIVSYMEQGIDLLGPSH